MKNKKKNNAEFIDTMDKINKIADFKGWENGIDWVVNFAGKNKLISAEDIVEYKNCHKLRVFMAHGRAKDIDISNERNFFIKKFYKNFNNKIREKNKQKEPFKQIINNKNTNNINKKCFSSTEKGYIKSVMYDIYNEFQYKEFGAAAYAVYNSYEDVENNFNLFRAVKNGLDFSSKNYNAYKFLNILKPFRVPERQHVHYSKTELNYLKDLMYRIYDKYSSEEFGKAAYEVYSSNEKIYKNRNLLLVIKNGLYENRYKGTNEFYGIIKAFV